MGKFRVDASLKSTNREHRNYVHIERNYLWDVINLWHKLKDLSLCVAQLQFGTNPYSRRGLDLHFDIFLTQRGK